MERSVQNAISYFSEIYAQCKKLNGEKIIPVFEEGTALIDVLRRYRKSYYGNERQALLLDNMTKIEESFINPRSKYFS